MREIKEHKEKLKFNVEVPDGNLIFFSLELHQPTKADVITPNRDDEGVRPRIQIGRLRMMRGTDVGKYKELVDNVAADIIHELSNNPRSFHEFTDRRDWPGRTIYHYFYPCEADGKVGPLCYSIWDQVHESGESGYQYEFYFSDPQFAHKVWLKIEEKYKTQV